MALTDHSVICTRRSLKAVSLASSSTSCASGRRYSPTARIRGRHWRKLRDEPPDVAPEVLRHHNPVVTVEAPIPLLDTGGLYGLDFGYSHRA